MNRLLCYNLKVSYADGYSFMVRRKGRVISTTSIKEATELQGSCAWEGGSVSVVVECLRYDLGVNDHDGCRGCSKRDSCIRVASQISDPRYKPDFYQHLIKGADK